MRLGSQCYGECGAAGLGDASRGTKGPQSKEVSVSTPDPLFTSEQLAAFAATVITALVTLFGLDFSDDKKGALIALIGSAYMVFTLYHAARVRGSRALNAQNVQSVKKG